MATGKTITGYAFNDREFRPLAMKQLFKSLHYQEAAYNNNRNIHGVGIPFSNYKVSNQDSICWKKKVARTKKGKVPHYFNPSGSSMLRKKSADCFIKCVFLFKNRFLRYKSKNK